MLDLHDAAPLELHSVAVFAEKQRVPEADRGLDAEFAFESTQRRCRVESPITPGRSCEPVLVKHTDDGHHGQSSIGNLSIQPASFCAFVSLAEQRRTPAHVAGRAFFY